MDSLQEHIQSYGNAMDSLQSYKRMADQKFVDDWYKENVEVPKQKIESLAKGFEFTGGAVEGTKLLKKGGQYIAKRLKGGTEEADSTPTTGDDAGAGGGGDSSAGSSATSNARSGADAGGSGDTGGSASADAGTGSGADAEGGLSSLGYTEEDAEALLGGGARASNFGTGAYTSIQGGEAVGASRPLLGVDDEFGGQSLEQARSLGQQTMSRGAQSAPDPTSGGNSATGNSTGADGDLDAPVEGPTLEGAPTSVIEKTAGKVAGDALSTGAEEGAGGVMDAVVGGLSTTMDFLGPLGLLAGIGLDIYEAFHHAPKAPKPPQAVSNRTQGSLVLPTYDSVQDTPASSSAF